MPAVHLSVARRRASAANTTSLGSLPKQTPGHICVHVNFNGNFMLGGTCASSLIMQSVQNYSRNCLNELIPRVVRAEGGTLELCSNTRSNHCVATGDSCELNPQSLFWISSLYVFFALAGPARRRSSFCWKCCTDCNLSAREASMYSPRQARMR